MTVPSMNNMYFVCRAGCPHKFLYYHFTTLILKFPSTDLIFPEIFSSFLLLHSSATFYHCICDGCIHVVLLYNFSLFFVILFAFSFVSLTFRMAMQLPIRAIITTTHCSSHIIPLSSVRDCQICCRLLQSESIYQSYILGRCHNICFLYYLFF